MRRQQTIGKRILAILGTLGILMAGQAANAPAAFAVTINVTTTADVSNPADGLTSLREAVAESEANGTDDVIVLAAATYSLTDCGAGELRHDANNDLTIQGNGATIDQTCIDTRIFDKGGPNTTVLTLQDMTLATAPNSGVNIDGLAVRGTSQLVLDGVTATGVNAGPGGSVVQVDFGPAQFDLDVADSTFDNNTGSAFINLNPSGFRVVNSVVTNHTGSGLIGVDGTPIAIEDSTIANNGGFGLTTTGQGGGGIQPIIDISNTTIANNGQGGVKCTTACRSLTLTDSNVMNNGLTASPGQGGGISMVFFGSGFPPAASVAISGSTISGNVADHNGGGLWIHRGAQLDGEMPSTVITDSTFDGNTALCAGCAGGGISVEVGNLTIGATAMTNNQAAGAGGGVHHVRSQPDTLVGNTSFALTDGTVTGNSAQRGGGIYAHSATQNIVDSTIAGNSAVLNGGGLEVGGVAPLQNGVATISGTTISGNQAGRDGGGLTVDFPDGSAAALVNSTISGNTAVRAGGGTATSALVSVSFDHTTVVQNSAPQAANVGHSGVVTVGRSVIADPVGGTNCDVIPGMAQVPSVATLGHTWASDASCGLGNNDTVAPGADPDLGPLANNGGPTLTHLPAGTSPVLSLVLAPSCSLTTDQRAEPRPVATPCDAGSVEVADGAEAPIEGTAGSDALVGTSGDDTILGFAGADWLAGRAGDDHLEGGAGKDTLLGGPGDDLLQGGRGADLLVGGPGNDILEGGPGRDILVALDPDDVLDGGPGRDLCFDYGKWRPRAC